MAQSDIPVPDHVQWWLAHEGCGALVWDGETGAVLGANARAQDWLAGADRRWTPGEESVRDVFGLAVGTTPADLATWLGAQAPREQRVSRPGRADVRVVLLTWRLPEPRSVWATLVLDLDVVQPRRRPGEATAAHMVCSISAAP